MGSCEIRDLPTVKNARRILVRPYRGSVVRYKCNRGFHLYGPHLFHCVDHKEWSHLEAPVCASKSNIISLETSNGPASYTVLENHSWKVSFLYNVVWVPERSLQFAKLFLFLILAEGQISQGDWVEAFKWCSFFAAISLQDAVVMKRKCIKLPTDWPRSRRKELYTNSSAMKEPFWLDHRPFSVTDTNGTILHLHV